MDLRRRLGSIRSSVSRFPSNIEHGKAAVPDRLVARLALALEVDLHGFIDERCVVGSLKPWRCPRAKPTSLAGQTVTVAACGLTPDQMCAGRARVGGRTGKPGSGCLL